MAAALILAGASLSFAPPLAALAPRAALHRAPLIAPALRAPAATLLVDDPVAVTSTLVSFADQGNNLAGIFFQASLLPYVLFLYFLGYEGNRTPKLAMFGHQFLLLFVISTVFTGIVTKSVYTSSLADVDWLHGSAEALLTTSNLMVGLGYRGAIAGDADPEGGSFRYPAFGIFGLVVLVTAIGPSVLGLAQHDAFLAGIGNLDANPLEALGLALRDEPVNALSIPTWAIHFSSVFEWLFAMGMVTQYAKTTGNPRWKWLTYGMLPLHMSGVAACTYHFFFNSADVKTLVELQAGTTLLGNTTVFIAALLLALSNGWTLADANPVPKVMAMINKEEPPEPAEAEPPAPLVTQEVVGMPLYAAELVLATVVASYVMKYGMGEVPIAFEPNAIVGWAICLAIPALVGYRFVNVPNPAAEA